MNELVFIIQVVVVVSAVMLGRRFKKEGLMVLAVLLAVFANFFVLKQIDLMGWTVTCADAYVIGHLLCLNLIQQECGKEWAKKTVQLSFGAMVIFALLSEIHLVFMPSEVDVTQVHYQALLGIAPRLLLASLGSFYLVQRLDIYLFGKLLNLMPKTAWKIRSAISLVISQAVDTLLFTLLGLYGVVDNWLAIFWMSFVVKCVVIGLMAIIWREKVYELCDCTSVEEIKGTSR